MVLRIIVAESPSLGVPSDDAGNLLPPASDLHGGCSPGNGGSRGQRQAQKEPEPVLSEQGLVPGLASPFVIGQDLSAQGDGLGDKPNRPEFSST